jgi:hypothetical protein
VDLGEGRISGVRYNSTDHDGREPLAGFALRELATKTRNCF